MHVLEASTSWHAPALYAASIAVYMCLDKVCPLVVRIRIVLVSTAVSEKRHERLLSFCYATEADGISSSPMLLWKQRELG